MEFLWKGKSWIAAIILLAIGVAVVRAEIHEDELPPTLKYLYKEDFETWKPPTELEKKVPYYLSGYDYEKRPVWVLEFGKYDFRSELEKGEDHEKNVNKYIEQWMYRMLKSIPDKKDASTDEPDSTREVVIILDFDGYEIRQLGSPITVSFLIKTIRRLFDASQFINFIHIINANYASENLINLVKPILGSATAGLVVHGTNPAKWRPVLLQNIPQNQLPEWYGGSPDFKPIKVFG